MAATRKARCDKCDGKEVGLTVAGKYRKHANADGGECFNSGRFPPDGAESVPWRARCLNCGKQAPTKDGRFLPHTYTSPSNGKKIQCPSSGQELTKREADSATGTESPPISSRAVSGSEPTPTAETGESAPTAEPALPPSDTTPETPTASAAATGDAPSCESSTPEPSTNPDGPKPSESRAEPEIGFTVAGDPWPEIRWPDPPGDEQLPLDLTTPAAIEADFQRPAATSHKPKPVMSELGQRIAEQVKTIFFNHVQQGRSSQKKLGPSEIGYACDRRLVMKMLGWTPVNLGGDGWAAFVGTCIHAGFAEMFQAASGQSGRYAVELSLDFPSHNVPHGTTDLFDRVMCLALDWKAMGDWSLSHLKSDGAPPHYRVQVQTYAYGASIRGEKVKDVAIVALPRTDSTLDQLWVWTEPFDPSIGRDALARVDRLADWAFDGNPDPVAKAKAAAVDTSDCRYCPFYQPRAGEIRLGGGCPGK